MPNGFNAPSGQAPHTATAIQVIHPTIPAVPSAAAVPPAFALNPNQQRNSGTPTGITAFNGIVAGGMFLPFGMHGPYQSSAQTSQYNPAWNYGYNLAHYQIPNTPPVPPVLNEQTNVTNNSVTNSVPNASGISSSESIILAKQKKETVESTEASVAGSSDGKTSEMTNSQLTEEMIALKVSSLLTESTLLKDAISETLQNKNGNNNNDKSPSHGLKSSVTSVVDVISSQAKALHVAMLDTSSVNDTYISDDLTEPPTLHPSENLSHVDTNFR